MLIIFLGYNIAVAIFFEHELFVFKEKYKQDGLFAYAHRLRSLSSLPSIFRKEVLLVSNR